MHPFAPSPLAGRGPLALLSYLGAVDVEKYWNRKEQDANETQQATCPRNPKINIHGVREQWEESAEEAADESIYRDGGVRVEAVAVNEVAHALPEGHHAA